VTYPMADGLELPDDAAAQVFAFIGRRGSGKTYAAGRLVEGLLEGLAQVVVIDPVGVWWGLRLERDGVTPAFAIPVFGGQHGDIPLSPTAGVVVARLVAEKGVSLVLDVSEFSGAEARRFVADFATELLHAKKRNKSALMVVWEEAQEFAPQRASSDVARMLGAVEKLIKLGRNFGIGTTLVTQRPQAVNKDVLNQAECLFALQMTGPQERKTVDGWVQEKGADRSIVGELPGLPVGTALVWSPQWLGVFGRFAILPKHTYDASATPGALKVAAAPLGALNLEEVAAAMAETIEKAKADDPKELRRQVALLEREIATLKATGPETRVEIVEKPVLSDEDWELLAAGTGALRNVLEQLKIGEDRISRLLAAIPERASGYVVPTYETERVTPLARGPVAVPNQPAPATPSTQPGPLSKAERAVLSVLAQFPAGRTRVQIALLSGYSIKSSTMGNTLGSLRSKNLVSKTGEPIVVLPEGLAAIDGQYEPLPRDVLTYWCDQLDKASSTVLRVLAGHWPEAITKDHLAEESGYSLTSSSLGNALGKLRSLELIDRGPIRASDDLMEAPRG